MSVNLNPSGWPWTEEVNSMIYKNRTYWPKISIVTPSYNQGQFIEETILSVLNQNYPNLEYIIIDGGSTDNTVEIIKKYEDRITYWISEKDKGQAHAINKGFEKATGVIRAYLNSDDVYYPNAILKAVYMYFTSLTDTMMIIGDCIYGVNLQEKGLEYDSPNFPNSYYDALCREGLCPQPSVFWTLPDRLKEELIFDENLNFCMDYEFWLKLIKHKYQVLRIKEPLSFFRIHSDSKTSNLQLTAQIENISITSRYSSNLTIDERAKVLGWNKTRINRIIYADYKQNILFKKENISVRRIVVTDIPLTHKFKLLVFKLKAFF